MGLRAKFCNLHVWWYHRLSTPPGPLSKIDHTHFILVLLYSRDELSLHTKFYRNRLKNKKVRLHCPFLRGRFVRKWKCLKFVIFKDPLIKSLYNREDNAIRYFFVYQIYVHDIFFSKSKDTLFYTFPVC